MPFFIYLFLLLCFLLLLLENVQIWVVKSKWTVFISLMHLPGLIVHDHQCTLFQRKTCSFNKMLPLWNDLPFWLTSQTPHTPNYLTSTLQDPINFSSNILYNSEIHCIMKEKCEWHFILTSSSEAIVGRFQNCKNQNKSHHHFTPEQDTTGSRSLSL